MEHQNKTPIRVAFDSSVLGYAQYGAGGRTGVYRMADNLARGLARDPHCELYFCGAENLRMWVSAREYIRNDPDLSSIPVLSYRSPARVYRFFGKYFWEMAKSKELALPARALRRALAESLRVMDRRVAPLEATELRGKDIFHSPFFALPESTRGVPCLKRVLSVCDLINIRQPQFARGGADFLKTILSTIEPADWVVAISECTKQDLCEYMPELDPERVRVVPLAASDDFHPVLDPARISEVRTKHGLAQRSFFLSVCTLDPRKNLEGLVSAFSHWVRQQSISEVDLVLCGSLGVATVAIQEQIHRAGLGEGRVRLLGYVPDVDLAPLYAGALGFVYPSFYEGFGLPVVEAMQCGVPVITSIGSSLQEVAQGAALLVDPSDPEAIAAALHTLYNDSAIRAQLRQKGLERAKQYSWEKSTRELMATYAMARDA